MNVEQTTRDRLISLNDVAGCLGVSVRQVWRLIAREELPPPVKVGRLAKMFISDIDEYMDRLRSKRK